MSSRSEGQTLPAWVSEARQIGKRYSAVRADPALHNLINLSTLALLFLLFGAALALSQVYIGFPALRFLVQAIVFGYAYFVVHILVIHEASHNNFLLTQDARRTKALNRICGWAACLYFGIDYDGFWGVGHPLHHRDPLIESDPQNCERNTLTGKPLLMEMLKVSLSPLHAFKSALACPPARKAARRTMAGLLAAQIFMLGTFLAITLRTHAVLMFVAAIYGFGFVQSLNLLKIAMEHGGSLGRQQQILFRSRSSDFFMRSLVMPLNISMHFEHHLNETIPWYRLGKAHAEIAAIVPGAMKPQLFSFGLRETLRQVV